MIKKCLILSIVFSFVFIGYSFALNGGEGASSETTSSVNEQPETQWVWGEVVAVDPAQNLLSIKYLDYETDQEKELTLSVNDKTTFENVRSLSEIKMQSPAGIDYILDSEGKGIATNISIENVEGLANEGQPLQEATSQSKDAGAAVQVSSKDNKN